MHVCRLNIASCSCGKCINVRPTLQRTIQRICDSVSCSSGTVSVSKARSTDTIVKVRTIITHSSMLTWCACTVVDCYSRQQFRLEYVLQSFLLCVQQYHDLGRFIISPEPVLGELNQVDNCIKMLISSSLPVEQNVPVKPGKQEHKNAVVELLIHIPLFWHGAL